MAFEHIDLSLPEGFANEVRLFPLPNLVLFPGLLQGLHIFEPRYRRLLSDAVDSDSLITMATIDPRVSDPGREPQIHPAVCIGRIVTRSTLADGRSNLLLLGLRRARIAREISHDKPYRAARVELINEKPGSDQPVAKELQGRLLKTFEEYAGVCDLGPEVFQQVAASDLPLGLVSDMITYASNAPVEFQIEMLTTANWVVRAKRVLEMLEGQIRTASAEGLRSTFPPRFSLN